MNLMSSIHSHPYLLGAGAAAAAMAAVATAFFVPVSALAERSVSSPWTESFSVMSTPADEDDALPPHLVSGAQALTGLDFPSSRSLGEDEEGIKYWTAFNSSDELCLIAALPGELQFTGMGCADSSSLKNRALRLQVADRSTAVNVYLLPDSFKNSVTRLSDAKTSDSLLIEHPYLSNAQPIEEVVTVTNPQGQKLDLTPFSEIDTTFGAGKK